MYKLALGAMATVILALCVIVVSKPAAAQNDTTEPARTEEYCMVLATSNLLGTKVTITVDKGQEIKLFRNTGAVKDDEGKLKKFNTVIDALNYMNEDGWVFVDAYTVTIGQQNVYHYMMKRTVEVQK
jgi:hypothetical protein